MQLTLKRESRTDTTTIGRLWVNDEKQPQCYVLEDKDRGLSQTDTLKTIAERKVYGKTAIPAGKYEVVITYSERFKQYLPLLLGVPGFAGIRLHWGNDASASLGCLIIGTAKVNDNYVSGSRVAFAALFKRLKAVERKEKIWITIS